MILLFRLKAFNYFHKTLHQRCLIGFLVRLWSSVHCCIYAVLRKIIPRYANAFWFMFPKIWHKRIRECQIYLSYNPRHNILAVYSVSRWKYIINIFECKHSSMDSRQVWFTTSKTGLDIYYNKFCQRVIWFGYIWYIV